MLDVPIKLYGVMDRDSHQPSLPSSHAFLTLRSKQTPVMMRTNPTTKYRGRTFSPEPRALQLRPMRNTPIPIVTKFLRINLLPPRSPQQRQYQTHLPFLDVADYPSKVRFENRFSPRPWKTCLNLLFRGASLESGTICLLPKQQVTSQGKALDASNAEGEQTAGELEAFPTRQGLRETRRLQIRSPSSACSSR